MGLKYGEIGLSDTRQGKDESVLDYVERTGYLPESYFERICPEGHHMILQSLNIRHWDGVEPIGSASWYCLLCNEHLQEDGLL